MIKSRLKKILYNYDKPRFNKSQLESIYIKLKLARYEIPYLFYKKQFESNAIHQAFSLTAKQVYGENRMQGVSGYYRLYNEEDFLEASVESHLPFFDELVLVHDCTTTDKTPEICQALVSKYPDKIKYFVYEPEAFKVSTRAYRMLPSTHPNSFVNYYNFALSKTTKQILTKVDGDHIAIKPMFERIAHNIHNADFMYPVFYKFSGINLWLYDDEIYVDPTEIPGLMGDHGFHAMRHERHYYTKDTRFENGYFFAKNRQWKNAGILYFHLKNMRSNIPYQSYLGLNDMVHQAEFKKTSLNTKKHLLNWQAFIDKHRDDWLKKTGTDIGELPNPNIYLQDLIATLSNKHHCV